MLRDYLEEQIRELEKLGLVRDKEETKMDFFVRGMKLDLLNGQSVIDRIMSRYVSKEDYKLRSPEAKRVLNHIVLNLGINKLDLKAFRVINAKMANSIDEYELIRDKEKAEWFKDLNHKDKLRALGTMYKVWEINSGEYLFVKKGDLNGDKNKRFRG